MELENIIKDNKIIKGIKDFSFGALLGTTLWNYLPAIPTLMEEEEKKEGEKASGKAEVSGLLGGLLASIGGYAYAFSSGHPEVILALPATWTASYIAAKCAGPYSAWRHRRQEKKRIRKQAELERLKETSREKLSLTERVLGVKQTRFEVRPHLDLKPNMTVYVNDEKQKDVKVKIDNEASPEKIDPVAKYKVSNEPFYVSVNGERELFIKAADNKLPIMLKGPTGCGKTRFVEHMAYKLGRPLVTVNCQEDLSAADLCGRILLNGEGTYWQDGPLATAARHGAICYLDEVVEARNDAMVLIHSLTDHRRILPIDKTGEVVEAHPDFMLVVSYNPHYQSAMKDMKQSTRQRFIGMEFDYPEYDKEVEILQEESDLDEDHATKLVDFGRRVRQMKGQGLYEGASTRLLTYAGKLIKSGMDPLKAVENAVVYPITDETDVQKNVMELAQAILE